MPVTLRPPLLTWWSRSWSQHASSFSPSQNESRSPRQRSPSAWAAGFSPQRLSWRGWRNAAFSLPSSPTTRRASSASVGPMHSVSRREGARAARTMRFQGSQRPFPANASRSACRKISLEIPALAPFALCLFSELTSSQCALPHSSCACELRDPQAPPPSASAHNPDPPPRRKASRTTSSVRGGLTSTSPGRSPVTVPKPTLATLRPVRRGITGSRA